MMEASIDWARMARPQRDGYDTDSLAELHRRAPAPWHSSEARLGEPVEIGISGPPLLAPPRFLPAAQPFGALGEAIGLVAAWPEMAAQWPRIVSRIQPFTDVETTSQEGKPRIGSCSHNESGRLGLIGLTVDCPLGAAQALVHEAAHHKLRIMGVDNEASVRLLANDPAQMYFSPIVGRPRPMTALLHAHYSFMHVLELDLRLLEVETEEDRHRDVHTLLARNAPRVADMTATLRAAARPDRDGEPFLAALLEWADEALRAAAGLLASTPAFSDWIWEKSNFSGSQAGHRGLNH